MLELLREALKSDAGSFGFVFSFLTFSGIVIWKVSSFNTKFNSVGKLELNIDTINTNIQYLKGSVQLLNESLNPLAQRKSPVTLTEQGKKIHDELNISSIVLNHWGEIKKEIESKLHSSCNPYDIQVTCFDYGNSFQSFLNADELDKLKKHAFNSGITLSNYAILFGISFRDKILIDRGYQVNDIDQYDPNASKP